MEVQHLRNKIKYKLDRRVFYLLCENFCLLENTIYIAASENEYITLNDLAKLARSVGLPYAIFFASFERLKKLIDAQNTELFGVLDGRYIIGARGTPIDIRWIRRIILDLSRKQKLYREYHPTGKLVSIVGFLKASKRTVREQADYILSETGIDLAIFRRYNKKSDAFTYLRKQLATRNIHVSVEARNHMPQSIPDQVKKQFSGIYIRDWKNPYLFISNELSGSPELGSGRKIYTLIFLLVCLFKDKSYAVSIGKDTYSVDKKKYKQLSGVYEIVNELLMPLAEIQFELQPFDYEALEKLSRKYNVTPKAMLQRLYDTRVINNYDDYKELSDECAKRFAALVKKGKDKRSGSPGKDVMIAYYQGDFLEFVRTYVPDTARKDIMRKHISFNRLHYQLELS